MSSSGEIEEQIEAVTLNEMRIQCLRKHSSQLLDSESQFETAGKSSSELVDLRDSLRHVGVLEHPGSFSYDPGTTLQHILKLIQTHGKVRYVDVVKCEKEIASGRDSDDTPDTCDAI